MMAVALAMAGVVGLAHLLGLVASQRRTARQQATAVREAGNLMENLATRRWAQLSPDQMAKVRLSEDCLRCLPGATLRVDVNAEDQDTKRVRVEIGWRGASGRRVEPVRLTAWRFRDEEPRR
jgi:Tfp pilus assembly protein PilV